MLRMDLGVFISSGFMIEQMMGQTVANNKSPGSITCC